MSLFPPDPAPGRPKILFIGWPESSHTHSWIDLLERTAFNPRLFCLPSTEPPGDWPVRCYLTAPGAPRQHNATRQTLFPPRQMTLSYGIYLLQEAMDRGAIRGAGGQRLLKGLIRLNERLPGQRRAAALEAALARAITDWRPDVIHTLGFDPAAYFYLRTREAFGLEGIGRWVAQARGGPDIALQRYVPSARALMEKVFATCDHFIADNQQNYDFALSAGLAPRQVSEPGMSVVSGAGGLDLEGLRAGWSLPPSKRERVIVWPKAYEITTAKAMPVFEAILKVWDQIQPCRIDMLWMTQPEVRIWYEKLFPEAIKRQCPAYGRLTRAETLEHISRARVLLAPSLSDGIPNTMLEAMALGAAPLVSPLDTITPVVEAEKNVVFARNLYPDEIAAALVRMMSDDALVDRLAENNLARIRELSDRARIKVRAKAYYEAVATAAGWRDSG